MILISILLTALLLASAAIIVGSIFAYKERWLKCLIAFCLVVSLVVGVSCLIINANIANKAEYLSAESAEILLYYNTISNTDNEYVRFDFYERVRDYNDDYADYQEGIKNPWVSWMYKNNAPEDVDPIDFVLNTGTYG